jgi:hypothetical protein
MQAAQVLKQHREAVECHEKKKEEAEHRHREGDGDEPYDSEPEEEEILVEVPKYLQGIPLVDPHTEKAGEV